MYINIRKLTFSLISKTIFDNQAKMRHQMMTHANEVYQIWWE